MTLGVAGACSRCHSDGAESASERVKRRGLARVTTTERDGSELGLGATAAARNGRQRALSWRAAEGAAAAQKSLR